MQIKIVDKKELVEMKEINLLRFRHILLRLFVDLLNLIGIISFLLVDHYGRAPGLRLPGLYVGPDTGQFFQHYICNLRVFRSFSI